MVAINRPIRLAQVTHGMGIGGMERVTADIVRLLHGNGYEISIYCTHERGELADEVEALGCEVVFEPKATRFDHWAIPFRVFQFLKKRQPDVVHTQHSSALLDGALAAKLAGVKGLVHTDHSKLYPIPKRHAYLERWMASYCNAYCAVSDHTRRDLIQHIGVPESRVEVVINGYDFDYVPTSEDGLAVRKSLGIPSEATVLGTVARIEPQKTQHIMIEAMNTILATSPDTHLMIVGGGSLEAPLRQLVKDRGLEHRVHLTGWQVDPNRYFAAMDIFVLSSLFEGLPISVIQAMGLGIPVVSTDAGGVKEIIHQDVHGKIVFSNDPVEFGHACLALTEHPERRAAMGQRAREYYQQNLTVQAMVDAYDQLYRRSLEGHF